METFLNNLEWRNATKGFDPSKKVEKEKVDQILKAIQMAPTSFGLQPFKVVVVENKTLQEKLKQVAWDQPQVAQASHLLVFCTRADLEDRTEAYLKLASGGDAKVAEKLETYGKMILGFFRDQNEEKRRHWAHKQAYIALGFAHAACAELKVDSCPIEGFVPPKVDEILGLGETFKSCVLLALGYRSSEQDVRPKVRFPLSDLLDLRS